MTLLIEKKQMGFTLIEVMVALTIIAISLGALLSTSGTQANNARYLKQKTLAHIIALNELTEISIQKEFPSIGKKTGSTSMANHDWHWQRTVTAVESHKKIRSITFTVFSDKKRENNLTKLNGFAYNNAP